VLHRLPPILMVFIAAVGALWGCYLIGRRNQPKSHAAIAMVRGPRSSVDTNTPELQARWKKLSDARRQAVADVQRISLGDLLGCEPGPNEACSVLFPVGRADRVIVVRSVTDGRPALPRNFRMLQVYSLTRGSVTSEFAAPLALGPRPNSKLATPYMKVFGDYLTHHGLQAAAPVTAETSKLIGEKAEYVEYLYDVRSRSMDTRVLSDELNYDCKVVSGKVLPYQISREERELVAESLKARS
jgi:hypothetical protein